jgi:hypothetical protein
MVLLNKRKQSSNNQLNEIKALLEDRKAKVDTAKAQKEFLLKQLKDNFECDTLDEAVELLEELTSDKEKIDKEITLKTNELIRKMEEEGLI